MTMQTLHLHFFCRIYEISELYLHIFLVRYHISAFYLLAPFCVVYGKESIEKGYLKGKQRGIGFTTRQIIIDT